MDLAARFERVKECELVLASKERLMSSRERSLNAAMQMLDKTKTQKRLLEDKVANPYESVPSGQGRGHRIANSDRQQQARSD